jgi:hypothetical protein
LVSPDIQQGEAVVRALDEAGLEVRAASWLRLAEAPHWRLVLAMPLVDQEGPRAGYQAIHKALAKQRATLALPLGQISVVRLKDPLYRVLKRLVRTARRAIAAIRVTDNVVDGLLVQDAYIYRSS